MVKHERRYDVDALRVLAILGVFFFHCSRFFAEKGWHITNAETSPLVSLLVELLETWGMPFLFVISGASIAFALRPGTVLRFIGARALRLLIPLAFGILVLAPPQIYLERLTHNQFQGSFLDFLPHAYEGWYFAGGNFDPFGVHLWYLEMLFLYTLALLPLLRALQTAPGRRLVAALGAISAPTGAILLWALPLTILVAVLDPLGMVYAGDPAVRKLLLYPLFLLYGTCIFSDRRIQEGIIRLRRAALAAAVGLSLTLPWLVMSLPSSRDAVLYWALMALYSLYAWLCILAALGYGMLYLNVNRPWLPYANQAVLPFYVLHQPVILLVGYFVVPLSLPILIKYLIIAPVALALVLGLYEFGIRRWNPMRALFGLKPATMPQTAPSRPNPPIPRPTSEVKMDLSKALPKETAYQLCSEIRREYRDKWYTLAGLQCWGCTTFSKGDQTRMCLCSRAGYRGCSLVSARYDRMRAKATGSK